MNLKQRGFQLVENLLLARHHYVKNLTDCVPPVVNYTLQRNFFLWCACRLPVHVSSINQFKLFFCSFIVTEEETLVI
jgi:hypothetical protein